jgi:hypothetical protein
MKIRILSNTIRLRLSQTEVQQLRNSGQVKDSIRFGVSPSQQLNYILQKAPIASIVATFFGNDICVSVPIDEADLWADTEQVALSHQMPIGQAEALSILIEKDFQCLTERGHEDETDLFPNPGEGC